MSGLEGPTCLLGTGFLNTLSLGRLARGARCVAAFNPIAATLSGVQHSFESWGLV